MNKDTTLIILYYRVSLMIVIGWLTFNRELVILMSLMQQVFDVNWGFSLTHGLSLSIPSPFAMPLDRKNSDCDDGSEYITKNLSVLILSRYMCKHGSKVEMHIITVKIYVIRKLRRIMSHNIS